MIFGFKSKPSFKLLVLIFTLSFFEVSTSKADTSGFLVPSISTKSYDSYYNGINVSFLIRPAIKVSYVHAIHYNTFFNLGIISSWSKSSSSLTPIAEALYSFGINDFYTIQLGTGGCVRIQNKDSKLLIGSYLSPSFKQLFSILPYFLLNLEIAYNIRVPPLSQPGSKTSNFDLGLGFIYKLN